MSERLKKSDVLTQLVSSGRSALSHPIRCTYRIIDHDGESNVKAAFTVSKKNFKSAVKRNKIKRQMREAFRLNKSILI
jgi:ribonuclease P protein component